MVCQLGGEAMIRGVVGEIGDIFMRCGFQECLRVRDKDLCGNTKRYLPRFGDGDIGGVSKDPYLFLWRWLKMVRSRSIPSQI